MSVRSVAKWLGIYFVCNLITAVGLFAAFQLLVHFAPPISREAAISIASRYLNNEYTQSANFLKEHRTDCVVENYPEGEFGGPSGFRGNLLLNARVNPDGAYDVRFRSGWFGWS